MLGVCDLEMRDAACFYQLHTKHGLAKLNPKYQLSVIKGCKQQHHAYLCLVYRDADFFYLGVYS